MELARCMLKGEGYEFPLGGPYPAELFLSTRFWPHSTLEAGTVRFIFSYNIQEIAGGPLIHVYHWDGREPVGEAVDINTCSLQEWDKLVDRLLVGFEEEKRADRVLGS